MMRLLLFACMLTGYAAYAQQINADLPDETEETQVLKKGGMQGEFACLKARFASGPQPFIFQGLVRYGLSRKIEMRVLIEEGYARKRYMEETVESTSPLALGTKIVLLEKHKHLPDITFVGYLKLPFTSRTKEESLYWSPIISLAFKHQFGKKFKLEYNPGVQQEAFSAQWVGFFNASLHYAINSRLESFVEYYGQLQQGQPQHNAGLGLFCQMNKNFGIYAVYGSSIYSDPANQFLSVGAAIKPSL